VNYKEYEVEIVDHRGVISVELYRVSSKEVLDLVVAQQVKTLPKPPQLVTIKEIELDLRDDKEII